MLTTFKLQKQTFKCTSTKKDKLKKKLKNCSNFSTHVKKYDEESFFYILCSIVFSHFGISAECKKIKIKTRNHT